MNNSIAVSPSLVRGHLAAIKVELIELAKLNIVDPFQKIIIDELKKGLQSGMSYCNSRQLKDIFLKAAWNIQTASGHTEGTPHLK